MKDINLNKLAYCKLFLHLAKYPHLSCNGLLLSKKNSSNNQTIEYVDCVPLFHSSLTLSPGFEIALSQVDVFCQQNDLEITGFYHAFENLNENQPNLLCYKLAEKIRENSSNSQCFLINNQKIHPSIKEPCFKVYNYNEQKFKELSGNVKLDELTYETCLYLLNEKKFSTLTDFDNHLDDIKLDWRNLNLNKFITSTTNAKIESLFARTEN